jgi:hypothetical protein
VVHPVSQVDIGVIVQRRVAHKARPGLSGDVGKTAVLAPVFADVVFPWPTVNGDIPIRVLAQPE